MSRRPLPKMPNHSPSAVAAPKQAPHPSLSPSQDAEFGRAAAAVQRCSDALKLLDDAPDGGDPQRRAALQAELDEHTAAFRTICQRLALKFTVATEAEVALMNRAQRRDYEAAMRKKRRRGPLGRR